MAAQGLDVNGFGQLLDALPLAQRLLRYRQLSQEALQKATKVEDEDMRAGYLSMAAGWHMLATEIERLRDRQQPATQEFPPGTGAGLDPEDSSKAKAPSGPTAQ